MHNVAVAMVIQNYRHVPLFFFFLPACTLCTSVFCQWTRLDFSAGKSESIFCAETQDSPVVWVWGAWQWEESSIWAGGSRWMWGQMCDLSACVRGRKAGRGCIFSSASSPQQLVCEEWFYHSSPLLLGKPQAFQQGRSVLMTRGYLLTHLQRPFIYLTDCTRYELQRSHSKIWI